MRKSTWLAGPVLSLCVLCGTTATVVADEASNDGRAAAAAQAPAAKVTAAIFRALGSALGGDSQVATPAIAVDAPATPTPAPADATHQLLKTVKVAGERGATLQTLTSTPDGHVVCLLGPSRYAAVGADASQSPQTEVRVFDRDGQEVRRWPVTFTGQSIAVGPQGDVFVAGDGRVARFTAEGKLDVEVEVPHIVQHLKDNEALERQAREQMKANVEAYQNEINSLKTQLERLDETEKNAKDQAEATKKQREQERRLLKSQLQAYENAVKSFEKQDLKVTVNSITSRMRIINGLSVTDKDVYLMCGETKGYGYSLWRMDQKLSSSEKVLSRLSGCCGQMDVQARGDQIAIAENTRHRVARYDRDGTLANTFGMRARESSGNSFGGCCNPMNCRIMPNGDVYTAESEGIVKKFNADGQFVALVGVVRLTGGCKNVAVAATASGDRVFFCDQPGSQFVILEPKPAAPAAAGGGQ